MHPNPLCSPPRFLSSTIMAWILAITGNEWHFLARIGKLWQTRLKTRTSADRYHALTLLTARNELRASTDGEQFVRYARVITTAP